MRRSDNTLARAREVNSVKSWKISALPREKKDANFSSGAAGDRTYVYKRRAPRVERTRLE